eukprot:GEMP01049576.1.p1 GENE.GEMP01049576.1~~GEMP01049576.1.p1  ORF type:complete len:111 (+),score=12.09 GEMP01049576.1:1014-1346(+)
MFSFSLFLCQTHKRLVHQLSSRRKKHAVHMVVCSLSMFATYPPEPVPAAQGNAQKPYVVFGATFCKSRTNLHSLSLFRCREVPDMVIHPYNVRACLRIVGYSHCTRRRGA